MANHKSSKKRIRQTATKRAHNRLYHKTTRNAVKALRNTSERSAAEALLPNRKFCVPSHPLNCSLICSC